MSAATASAPPRYRVEAIPAELRVLDRWCVTHAVLQPDNTWKKTILIAGTTGNKVLASSTNPKTWRSFAVAERDARARGLWPTFVFDTTLPYFFIDVDEVVDLVTGEVAEHATRLVEALDTYTEYGLSGDGYHIIGRGRWKPNARNTTPPVERYPLNGARFCIFTGNIIGERERVQERQSQLDIAFPEQIAYTNGGTKSAGYAGPAGEMSEAEVAAVVAWAKPFWVPGKRHPLSVNLAGYLGKSGVPEEQAVGIIEALAVDVDDTGNVVTAVRDSYSDLRAGGAVSGWSGLRDKIGIPEADLGPLSAILDGFRRRHREAQGENGSGTEESPGRSSQATKLVALARQDDTDLFHDGARKAYITFTSGVHRETWPLSGTVLRDWLSARFYAVYGSAPGSQALQDAVHTLAGIARFEGECRSVFVRLAGHDEEIYLDLGNEEWEIVRITALGWDIIPAAGAPVRFRRPGGLLPLPRPERGGDLSALRRLVNVKNDAAFTLVVAWLLGVLRPSGPYTMLYLAGEQGTAKTTLARMLRSLIDPNVSPLRTEPREEGDLLIAATNGAVVALDNLSHLPGWLSDSLCRLATGGGLSKRTLYTDADETLIDAQRPILLTGIETVLTRGDAVDRSLLVELEKISDDTRRTEAELNAEFEASRPALLGVLLDAASVALRNWPATTPARLPRMADFARWVEAGAPAFGWEPRHFLTIYTGNRAEADEIAIDALPIGTAVRTFLADRETWEGTPTNLLTVLTERAGDTAKDRAWPKRAHNLSGQLKRLAPNLRRLGIDVELGVRGTDGRRLIRLSTHDRKDDATQRQERQERQDPHNGVASADAGQCQTASRPGATASSDQNENPPNHAENGQGHSLFDAVDALDAVDAPLQQVGLASSHGAAASDVSWARATRERL